MTNLKLGNKKIALNKKPYFVADLAANHDGDISRAKELVWIAKEAGADCAKFQHFLASKIVNDVEFKKLESLETHQSGWKKSVSEIYDQYHFKREWTKEIANECVKANIEFSTSPYDYEAVDLVDKYLSFYKIGSGDISWTDFIQYVAGKGKPVLIATGASSIDDVKRAMNCINHNQVVLMQCNTNYTVEPEKHRYVNLNVLREYANLFPKVILGLSDHTLGHGSVLGSIPLGARVFEKHFTDDNDREGPDHKFALNPIKWKEMVELSEEVFETLGDGVKRVEENEKNAFIVQRRSIVCKESFNKGHVLREKDIDFLRPCPIDSFHPFEHHLVVGKTLTKDKKANESILKEDIC